jgi:predicted hydrocarbon binding protein
VIAVSKNTQRWVAQVTKGLEEQTDPQTCARILEACGRRCTPLGLIERARKIYADSNGIPDFVSRLGEVFEAVRLEDGAVYVIYPTCYCGQVKGMPTSEIPDSYCDCSVGWIKQLFESVLEHPVRVERMTSVIAGDPECRFRVEL